MFDALESRDDYDMAIDTKSSVRATTQMFDSKNN